MDNNRIKKLDQILQKQINNQINNYPFFFNFIHNNKKNSIYFVETSIFEKEEYAKYRQEFFEKKKLNSFTKLEKSSIGSMLGMTIGDAIGSRVEFFPLNYNFKGITGMGESKNGIFKLNPGQWTDDTSMGLCISDSLIEKKGEFDPRDIMMRFILWWYFGYNNAFRFDKKRESRHSVGLGGNISGSLYKYIKDEGKDAYTTYGNKKTSGNGSIMRNAPIPLCYFRNIKKALYFAKKQSLITHQGDEAAGCCQLMTFIIIKILQLKIGQNLNNEKNEKNSKIKDKTKDLDNSNFIIVEHKNNILTNENKEKIKLKDILDDLKDFNCECKSVNYLAQSKMENNDINRNWNWKEKNFHYSEERAKKKPGYIGSYCMDGLAMALHVLYYTDSFQSAILKAVNLCGDADSVGSVVGQIAGAFYEYDSIPPDWIKEVNKWDKDEIALRGFILCQLNEEEKEFKNVETKENIDQGNMAIGNINEIPENGIVIDKAKKINGIRPYIDETKLNNNTENTNVISKLERNQNPERVETKNNRCFDCCFRYSRNTRSKSCPCDCICF